MPEGTELAEVGVFRGEIAHLPICRVHVDSIPSLEGRDLAAMFIHWQEDGLLRLDICETQGIWHGIKDVQLILLFFFLEGAALLS